MHLFLIRLFKITMLTKTTVKQTNKKNPAHTSAFTNLYTSVFHRSHRQKEVI